ncbi:MAG TPA: BlaI/MecI/CopY family transcriptional regulator [Beutenbergiaceae bacterium]|nr:BlaI/MecI/CopY family transcriptional regulator [Beutenbergiaceae bacterium]
MSEGFNLPHLGPLEQQVMNVLWVSCELNDEPLTIRAVSEQMPSLAYTTVATVLTNLKSKGMVEQLRDQPVLRYRPARGRAKHAAWMMKQILAGAHNRSRCLEKFVAELDPDDIAVLRQLLQPTSVG